jgi:hypothetical protein
VCSGAFFFFWPRCGLGTPSISLPCGVLLAEALPDVVPGVLADAFAFGSARRELKDEINSMTCGESPSKLVKCSAASSFERVDPYSSTCWSSESGSGSSLDSCESDITEVLSAVNTRRLLL